MKALKIKSIITFAIILSACFTLSVSAKDKIVTSGYLEVFGKVKFQKKNLSGTTISVFSDDNEEKEYKAGSNGKFDIKLDMNKVYYIHFSKEGMVTKIVKITTTVPDSSLLADQYEYKFNVSMLPDFNGADKIEALKKPAAKIIYNKKYDGFDYDQTYEHQLQRELISMRTLPASSSPEAFINERGF